MRDDQTKDSRGFVEVHFTDSQGQEHVRRESTDTQELRFEFEGIRNIDLSPLSSCRSLEIIDLHNNQLQDIDLSPLSSCSGLRTLILIANKLQSIVLPSCSSLQTLNLHTNQLRRIDLRPLSSCTSLRELVLSGNRLKSVDLTPLSSCTSLRELDLSDSQLQSIDLDPLSSCTSLRQLCLGPNRLQSIDLSPLSSCANLQTLHLRGNKLQSIDLTPLSSCNRLKTLYLGGNQLRGVDLAPLSSHGRLKILDLSGNQLQSITCSIGAETLELVAPELASVVERLELPLGRTTPTERDLVILCRVVDSLWSGEGPEGSWRAVAVVQDLLSTRGLAWLGFLDTDPRTVMQLLTDNADRDQPVRELIRLVCEQVDRGGTTTGLDVERMTEHGELASGAQRVLDLRSAEMENAGVRIDADGPADLRALWLTAYGHSVLSALQLGTVCSATELEQVRDALDKMGISLKTTTDELVMPINISEPLREYIWRLADLRTRMKKR